MTRAEANQFRYMIDSGNSPIQTSEYLFSFLMEPKVEKSDFKFLTQMAGAVMNTLLYECGFSYESKKKRTRNISLRRMEYERWMDDLGMAREQYYMAKIGYSLQDYLCLSTGEIEAFVEVAKEESKARKGPELKK